MSVVHVVEATDANDAEVWIDTEDFVFDGLCLGTGTTRPLAIAQAEAELRRHLATLEAARESTVPLVHPALVPLAQESQRR